MLRFCSLAVLVAVGARTNYATSCMQLKPCAYLRPGGIVFIGTVTGGEALPKPARDGLEERTRRVRMTVSEIFAGLPKDTREVTIETGDWMRDGHDYLIDAHRGDGGVVLLGLCGFTREVDNRDEFVRYFRSRQKGAEPTTLTVHVYSRAALSNQWVEGAEVTIGGPEGQRSATTDHDGGAVFEGVAPGAYAVSASKSLFHRDPDLIQEDKVEVLEQTCAASSLYLSPENSVGGLLRLAGGKPAAHIELELVGINPERERAGYSPASYTTVTDDDGRFRFAVVFPGLYLLGTGILFPKLVTSPVMIAYYPGQRTREQAAEILVEPGKNVEGLQFTLPDIGAGRSIRIRVVNEKGSPVAGAKIHDRNFKLAANTDAYASVGRDLATGPDGWVEIAGFERARYVIGASSGSSLNDMQTSEQAEIPPGRGPVSLQLVVRPMRVPLPANK